MKAFIDKTVSEDYIEVKENKVHGGADLSIRTSTEDESIIITANLNEEVIERVITELVTIKGKIFSGEES